MEPEAVRSDYWGGSQTSFEHLKFAGAYDQFGAFEPYWPPMGYNIIVQMPQSHEEIRKIWPAENSTLFDKFGVPPVHIGVSSADASGPSDADSVAALPKEA